jgi:hypothetical protein
MMSAGANPLRSSCAITLVAHLTAPALRGQRIVTTTENQTQSSRV